MLDPWHAEWLTAMIAEHKSRHGDAWQAYQDSRGTTEE